MMGEPNREFGSARYGGVVPDIGVLVGWCATDDELRPSVGRGGEVRPKRSLVAATDDETR